jgi:hypothetical protein
MNISSSSSSSNRSCYCCSRPFNDLDCNPNATVFGANASLSSIGAQLLPAAAMKIILMKSNRFLVQLIQTNTNGRDVKQCIVVELRDAEFL